MKNSTEKALIAAGFLCGAFIDAGSALWEFQKLKEKEAVFNQKQEQAIQTHLYERTCFQNTKQQQANILATNALKAVTGQTQNSKLAFQEALAVTDLTVSINEIKLCAQNMKKLAQVNFEQNTDRTKNILLYIFTISTGLFGAASVFAISAYKERKTEHQKSSPTRPEINH